MANHEIKDNFIERHIQSSGTALFQRSVNRLNGYDYTNDKGQFFATVSCSASAVKKLGMIIVVFILLNYISIALAYGTKSESGVSLNNNNDASITSDDPVKTGEKVTLKVGVFQNKPVVFSEDGTAKGLFVDVLNYIAGKEGWDIEYVIVNLKDYLSDPHASNIDLMTCLGKNNERLKKLTYSKESIWTFWGTVYTNDTKIQSVLDLQNRKVGVRSGNKITADLKKLLGEFNVTPDYVGYDDYESAFNALNSLAIDAVAVNNTYAFNTANMNNINKTPIVFEPFSAYFAMPKMLANRKLLDKIDSYVVKLKNDKNSVYYHSIDKYGIGGIPPQWNPKILIFASVIIMVFIALSMGLWRYRSIVVINEDLKKSIRKRKLAEEEVLASNQQLRANELDREKLFKKLKYTNKELQDIVYTTSHDLRSPLVNIHGFCGELNSDCDCLLQLFKEQNDNQNNRQKVEALLEEKIPESLGFITGSTAKMSRLLDGLLQISRVGNLKTESVPVDTNKILEEVIISLKYKINEYNITIKAETLPDCISDSNMINAVLSNLIGNAIKYRDQAKECQIRISGNVEDGMSIYCVEDNGIGIKPDYQQKVFEVFHRLNPSEDIEGEGLGLSIVTRIIDRLGGEIWLDSEIDIGSKFFFALPIV
jgi:signal transduction histidine kinase/ABC-type amino acid transport substrate-binding protein